MNQVSLALCEHNKKVSNNRHKGEPMPPIKNVMVGRNQWEELEEEASAYGLPFHEDMENIHEANRPEWEGYKIYRVDAQDHISFS